MASVLVDITIEYGVGNGAVIGRKQFALQSDDVTQWHQHYFDTSGGNVGSLGAPQAFAAATFTMQGALAFNRSSVATINLQSGQVPATSHAVVLPAEGTHALSEGSSTGLALTAPLTGGGISELYVWG